MLQWNQTLETGISEIDSQHRELVGIINDLSEAMKVGKGKDVCSRIVAGMVDYAAVHFATEEKYFDQFRYPESALHRMEHRQFADRTAKFRADLEAGKILVSLEILKFLEEWLVKHITDSDMKYRKCFLENGLR